jgi:hypothetical protein
LQVCLVGSFFGKSTPSAQPLPMVNSTTTRLPEIEK